MSNHKNYYCAHAGFLLNPAFMGCNSCYGLFQFVTAELLFLVTFFTLHFTLPWSRQLPLTESSCNAHNKFSLPSLAQSCYNQQHKIRLQLWSLINVSHLFKFISFRLWNVCAYRLHSFRSIEKKISLVTIDESSARIKGTTVRNWGKGDFSKSGQDSPLGGDLWNGDWVCGQRPWLGRRVFQEEGRARWAPGWVDEHR